MHPRMRRVLGIALLVAGSGLFVFGGTWSPAVLAWTAQAPAGEWLELFVPFLPMAVIAFGAVVLAGRRPHRDG